jgi:hypothetical protein
MDQQSCCYVSLADRRPSSRRTMPTSYYSGAHSQPSKKQTMVWHGTSLYIPVDAAFGCSAPDTRRATSSINHRVRRADALGAPRPERASFTRATCTAGTEAHTLVPPWPSYHQIALDTSISMPSYIGLHPRSMDDAPNDILYGLSSS